MIYQNRIEQFNSEIKTAEKKYNQISIMRLLAFAAAAFGIVFVFYFEKIMSGWIITMTGLFVFIILVIIHNRVAERKRYVQLLCSINMDSLARKTGEWINFPDTGEEFTDLDHPYTRDLDIFGNGSLFQLINVTNTSRGRALLKSTLEKPYQPAEKINQMQDAVSELAGKLDWRQRFQAEGVRYSKIKYNSVFHADVIMQEREFNNKIKVSLIRISPVLLAGLIAAAGLLDSFPSAIPAFLAFLQMLAIRIYSKKTNIIIKRLLKCRDMIKSYRGLIQLVEWEEFSSLYLAGVRNIRKNSFC
jgi:hypothetical protein